MLLADVNILVYALRGELPEHARIRQWMEDALVASVPFGIHEPTLASFLRLVTNRRVFKTPTPLSTALAFLETVRTAPAAAPVKQTDGFWRTFERLCRSIDATGNDIPDAYLAAVAIDNDADFVTFDRGFSRFAGLTYREPF